MEFTMKKTIIFAIITAIAALSMFAAASSVDKAKKNADLDSIYQTVLQSRHELAMMQHIAKALESGATIEEVHEHFQAQAEKHSGGHDVQLSHEAMQSGLHSGMPLPKLKGTRQDKLNQLATEAEELQKLIRTMHEHMAKHFDGG